MSTSKKDQKRSRAINQIIARIGREKWYDLSISQKNKKIKIQIAKNKARAKKGREYMKLLKKEYCGYYQHCSWIPKRVLSTLLKLLFLKKIYNFIYIKLKLFLCRIYSKF